jgi:hypothetical protein
MDDRICKTCPTAGHISFTCTNHPTLHWSSKNMPGRSLFFFGARPGHGLIMEDGEENDLIMADGSIARECACPASDLVHLCGEAA